MNDSRRGPSGYALVWKRAGRTSFQTISDIKYAMLSGIRADSADGSEGDAMGKISRHDVKVGHAGTLDRFAEGLLVVLFGSYTRLSDYFMASEKTYEATICFGKQTDTLDPEGVVVATGVVPERTAVEIAMENFKGMHEQVPPDYSAVHVNGERACVRTRRGESIELRPRPVVIREFTLISWDPPFARVRVACTKGTYIRSLARDLAHSCGTHAYLSSLIRLASGPFLLSDAVDPEGVDTAAVLTLDSHTAAALGCAPVEIDADDRRDFLGGKPLDSMDGFAHAQADGLYAVFGPEGDFLGISRREEGKLSYRVVTGCVR